MTAIKRRLLIVTTAALALTCVAGEVSVPGESASPPSATLDGEGSSAALAQRAAWAGNEVQFATVTHPSQDAWAAMLRASSR